MAKIISEFPTVGRTRSSKYPWGEWLDGQTRCLEKAFLGDEGDFDCSPKSFRLSIYQAAKKAGVKVRTAQDIDANGRTIIYVQAFNDGPYFKGTTASGVDVFDDEPQTEEHETSDIANVITDLNNFEDELTQSIEEALQTASATLNELQETADQLDGPSEIFFEDEL